MRRKADVAPVTAFETGTNDWRRLPSWPRRLRERLRSQVRRRFISLPACKLELHRARSPATRHSTNTSPIRRSRFRFARGPIQPMGYGSGNTWPHWLVDDQREASGRPDVADVRRPTF